MSPAARHSKDKKRNWVILLLLLTAVSMGVSVWALFFQKAAPVLPPDFAPPDREEHAQPLPDTGEEKNESSSGGGSVNLTYSDRVSVDLSDKTVSLYFLNPSRSNHDIVLQLMIHETLVAQSGLFPAGYRLDSLELLPGAAERLREGGYNGKFIVFYYRQDTGERAIFTTEIPILALVQ